MTSAKGKNTFTSQAIEDNEDNIDTEKDIKKDTTGNKDIDKTTSNKIDINTNTKKDIKTNTKKNTKPSIKINTDKKKVVKEKLKGYHTYLPEHFHDILDALREETGFNAQELAKEAYEDLFNKYGVQYTKN